MIFFNRSTAYQNSRAFERRFKLHPLVQNILDNVLIYISLRFQKPIAGLITSTVSTLEEDVILHRKSTTHLEGRAFDLSVKDFTENEITDIEVAFTRVAGHLGAINKDGSRALIVDHNSGFGRHLHFQIAKDVALNFKE